LDNIDDKKDRKVKLIFKGQTVNTDEYYRLLFNDAGVKVQKEERGQLNKNYIAIKMWALY